MRRRVMTYTYGGEEAGEGDFVQYGTNYTEFDAGPGTFTTAIVEMDDGSVKNIDVSLIKFILTENIDGLPRALKLSRDIVQAQKDALGPRSSRVSRRLGALAESINNLYNEVRAEEHEHSHI